MKQDLLIGKSFINLQDVLATPLRQTANSYVHVLDKYYPIDEVDPNTLVPLKTLGDVRVIIYIEDLGPSKQLDSIAQLGYYNSGLVGLYNNGQQQNCIYIIQSISILPSQNMDNLMKDNQENQQTINNIGELSLQQEINSLEHRIIWELEKWKSVEEQKFQFYLKQKEIEFMQKLNDEWTRKDQEKEKVFKKAEGQMNLIEQKLKQKVNDLQKREQKIILVEEEQKTKMTEIARSIQHKDQEILQLKKNFKEEKTLYEKEKAQLNQKIEELTKQQQKQMQEFDIYKREQEISPISVLRNELQQKFQEILELQRENERITQVKDQFKEHYEKLRQELIKLKQQYALLQSKLQMQSSQEVENLKLQLNQKSNQEQLQVIQQLRQELSQLKQKESSTSDDLNDRVKSSNEKIKIQMYLYQQGEKQEKELNLIQHEENKENINYNWQNANLTHKERLLNERDCLLKFGNYKPEDPIIIEINKQIQLLN